MTRTDTVYLDAVTVALCLGSTGPGGHDLRGHLTLSVAVSKGEKKERKQGEWGLKILTPLILSVDPVSGYFTCAHAQWEISADLQQNLDRRQIQLQ